MDLSLLRPAGWRGGDLLTLGVIYLAVAVSVILAPDRQPDLVHTHLPGALRVGLWAVPGVLGVVGGWVRDRRLQGIAFGLLAFAPAERMLSFFAGATFYHGDRISPFWPFGAVALTGLAFLILAAFWPETWPKHGRRRAAVALIGVTFVVVSIPFFEGGNHERWPGAVVYAAMLLLVLRAAARPEPVEPDALPAVLTDASRS